ncbi:cation diffusion facilitator family transporter [Antarctobacter heliothermus]|uniref:Cation diffusion facilitator family transporter n=1 Tax=Antarctobacter heliothermus TaxID=74033 RepID=A0A239L8X9_9RHOB|nr:cation diffusion facilitator family transporter [Antarctobacter heliothermus]
MWKSSRDDLNTRSALWHIIQTFVGSLLIIVTALVIEFTGFLAIDPILGIAFGVVLLWASVGVIREAVHILLEGTPEDLDLEDVTADLRGQDGVLDVHHVHAWTLTSDKHVFSAHVRHAEPADAARILETAYGYLTGHHGFHVVTLQLETACLDEARARDLDVTRSGGPEAHRGAPDHSKHPA